jgi:quercetin dioxygenase-like cupin family protein
VAARQEITVEFVARKPSVKGPREMFTGDVWIDMVVQGEEPSRIRVNVVHFTPGARTAWHSHALGQTLVVTDGVGLVQSRGRDIESIRTGDIVHTPALEEHWHGASPENLMTHISVTEGVAPGEGPEANWGDHVTDAEYRGQVT